MPEVPDEVLLEKWLAGDEVAFEALFQRYSAALFRYFSRLGARGGLAEDLTQETFLKVLTGAGGFDPLRKFSTWLYAIATNAWRDQHKRTRRRLAWSALVGSWGHPLAGGEQPLTDLMRREAAVHVEEVLQSLPDEVRAILVMKHFQGLRYEEIGEVLGIPLGTVKSRLHAAVMQVRGRLARKGLLPEEGS